MDFYSVFPVSAGAPAGSPKNLQPAQREGSAPGGFGNIFASLGVETVTGVRSTGAGEVAVPADQTTVSAIPEAAILSDFPGSSDAGALPETAESGLERHFTQVDSAPLPLVWLEANPVLNIVAQVSPDTDDRLNLQVVQEQFQNLINVVLSGVRQSESNRNTITAEADDHILPAEAAFSISDVDSAEATSGRVQSFAEPVSSAEFHYTAEVPPALLRSESLSDRADVVVQHDSATADNVVFTASSSPEIADSQYVLPLLQIISGTQNAIESVVVSPAAPESPSVPVESADTVQLDRLLTVASTSTPPQWDAAGDETYSVPITPSLTLGHGDDSFTRVINDDAQTNPPTPHEPLAINDQLLLAERKLPTADESAAEIPDEFPTAQHQQQPVFGEDHENEDDISRQNASRQNITGRNVTGQNLTGQNLIGQNLIGQNLIGQNFSSQNVTSQTASSQTASSQTASSQNIDGQNVASTPVGDLSEDPHVEQVDGVAEKSPSAVPRDWLPKDRPNIDNAAAEIPQSGRPQQSDQTVNSQFTTPASVVSATADRNSFDNPDRSINPFRVAAEVTEPTQTVVSGIDELRQADQQPLPTPNQDLTASGIGNLYEIESQQTDSRIRNGVQTQQPAVQAVDVQSMEPQNLLAANGPLQTDGAAVGAGMVSGDVAPQTQPFSQQIIDALQHAVVETPRASNVSIRLDPPELGELVVDLVQTDDGFEIRVKAAERVTLEMLLSRGPEIERSLRHASVDVRSLEVGQLADEAAAFTAGGDRMFDSHRGNEAFQFERAEVLPEPQRESQARRVASRNAKDTSKGRAGLSFRA